MMRFLPKILFSFYICTSTLLAAKEVRYFYSGVGMTASLGPGATLVGGKEDTFMSGSMSAGGSAPAFPNYVVTINPPNAASGFIQGNLSGTLNSWIDRGDGVMQISGPGLLEGIVNENTPISRNDVKLIIFTQDGEVHESGLISPQDSPLQFAIVGPRIEDDGVKSIFDLTTNQHAVDLVIEPPLSQYRQVALQDAGASSSPLNNIINFYQPQDVRNKTGLSYLLGITSQYVFEKGVTVGFSVNYGRTGSNSVLEYRSGSVKNQQFQASDTVNFSMKDKGYISELLQLGYAWRRINPYFIFGLAQHRARLTCPGAYQNDNSKGLSKGYNAPVFGLGINVAMNKNLYFNIQWQRHFGRTNTWDTVGEILPGGRIAAGAPQTRFGASMILMGVTYITPFKTK